LPADPGIDADQPININPADTASDKNIEGVILELQ
jgi:hypothetical protein